MTKPRNFFVSFVVAFVVFSFDPVHAAILYVDNKASCPGSGSSASPYCSIQNAVTNVQAGDTVRIRSGTGVYSETASVSGRNGTAQNPILIEPDPGANFVLHNTSTGRWAATLRIKESDYWTVRGLTFDANGVNPSLVALHIQCETKNCVGIRVEGNTFKNWRAQAGHAVAPQAISFAGCDTAFGCAQNRTITGIIENNLFENIDRQAIGMARNLNTIVRNNEIRNVRCGRGDDQAANTLGIHITYGNVGLQVYNNTIHSFVSKGDCPIFNGLHGTTAGVWCDVNGGVDSQSHVYDNVVYGMDAGDNTVNMPNGGLSHRSQGIFIENGCQGWHVYRNVVYDIGSHGIRNSYHSLPSSGAINQYYNNVIYNIALVHFYQREGRPVIKNNIFAGGNPAVYIEVVFPAQTQMTANHNLYQDSNKVGILGSGIRSLTSWQGVCNCDANSVTGNPQFVNANTADFHLMSSSPARGAGENGADIGAYPYTATQVPNTPSNVQVIPN